MALRIKELIKEKGTTVKELAQKMGISNVGLSQHINGNPSVEVLERIASALGVDISELFTPFSGGIIGVIRIKDTNYNINSVSDLSRLLDRIESGEIVL
ncbi:helix-turn-helix domain-containing protein [Bacteroides salyersiae]|uniref:helix-turn-helix domain-containing protein n=1 Tax=Bacteroides salyersiae TaxID=291644 RepID=UPI00221FDB61|nr:helix-turn-helix transcriptional regulator [Bacteroides salyersiae]UYU41507.1 helix-turn-helix domain-containing protein [Bacteroides salyersiae]